MASAVFSEGTRGWHAQTSSKIVHILFSQEMTNVSISCDTLHSNRYLSYPRILLQEKLLFLICKMGITLSLYVLQKPTHIWHICRAVFSLYLVLHQAFYPKPQAFPKTSHSCKWLSCWQCRPGDQPAERGTLGQLQLWTMGQPEPLHWAGPHFVLQVTWDTQAHPLPARSPAHKARFAAPARPGDGPLPDA